MRLGNASNFQIETREGVSEVEGGAHEGAGKWERTEAKAIHQHPQLAWLQSIVNAEVDDGLQSLFLHHHSSINETKALLVTSRILPCSCKLANCLVFGALFLGMEWKRGEREQEVQSAGIPIRSSFR